MYVIGILPELEMKETFDSVEAGVSTLSYVEGRQTVIDASGPGGQNRLQCDVREVLKISEGLVPL
jgi:hypothetical protein